MVWKCKIIWNVELERVKHWIPECSSEHVKNFCDAHLPPNTSGSENGFRPKWTWSALVAASSGVPVSTLNASKTLLFKYNIKVLGLGWNRILANGTVQFRQTVCSPKRKMICLRSNYMAGQ